MGDLIFIKKLALRKGKKSFSSEVENASFLTLAFL